MARTISEIQEDIIGRVAATANLADMNSTSKTALWRLWIYIVAVSIWALENLFDQHKSEVTSLINEKAPHSLRWYANKAKDFQYGSELAYEEDCIVFRNFEYVGIVNIKITFLQMIA